MPEIAIRPFAPADQPAVRALILAGLVDHFGELDPAFNHDLDDIAANYIATGGVAIVADLDGQIVGTGTLVVVEPGVARLVRMSVDRRMRGRGLGKRLVNHLIELARTRGDHRVLVETNDDWTDAIALYRSCGFGNERVFGGERHFERDLVYIPVAGSWIPEP
jgi:GNAT superfamily N-acetyltransferase